MNAKDAPLNVGDMNSLRDVLLGHVTKGQGVDDANAAVLDIVSTLYRRRLGPAAGSTAFNKPTGQTATRYYDENFKALRWLILTNPANDKLAARREDELTGNGWDIRERAWRDILYRGY